jgi:hypothetical protein
MCVWRLVVLALPCLGCVLEWRTLLLYTTPTHTHTRTHTHTHAHTHAHTHTAGPSGAGCPSARWTDRRNPTFWKLGTTSTGVCVCVACECYLEGGDCVTILRESCLVCGTHTHTRTHTHKMSTHTHTRTHPHSALTKYLEKVHKSHYTHTHIHTHAHTHNTSTHTPTAR